MLTTEETRDEFGKQIIEIYYDGHSIGSVWGFHNPWEPRPYGYCLFPDVDADGLHALAGYEEFGKAGYFMRMDDAVMDVRRRFKFYPVMQTRALSYIREMKGLDQETTATDPDSIIAELRQVNLILRKENLDLKARLNQGD